MPQSNDESRPGASTEKPTPRRRPTGAEKVCNGLNGVNGTSDRSGLNALVRQTPEPAGRCVGRRVRSRHRRHRGSGQLPRRAHTGGRQRHV